MTVCLEVVYLVYYLEISVLVLKLVLWIVLPLNHKVYIKPVNKRQINSINFLSVNYFILMGLHVRKLKIVSKI